MALKLYRKRSDGDVEFGWFEYENSIKKRANGWVTNSTGLKVVKKVTTEEKLIEMPVVKKAIKKSGVTYDNENRSY